MNVNDKINPVFKAMSQRRLRPSSNRLKFQETVLVQEDL